MLVFLYHFDFENEMDIVISYFNFNAKYHRKCKFALTFIPLVITSTFFPLEVVQK